ncbi:hypothetical protein [Tenacibaculum xiamenense]|uniref:hypothetical protein n=1 Tax=Tenacibaculum xiamenense TaxID=1261553 RepID=UPI00389623EB
MSQQFGIMVMVDVKAALKTKNLQEHVYLIGNMKDFGSQNEGTNHLVSKVNGTYWYDGSQAGEEVMNWLAIDINDLPRSVQRSAHTKSKTIESVLSKLPLLDSKNLKGGKAKEAQDDQLVDLTNHLKKSTMGTTGLHISTDAKTGLQTEWPLINTKGELVEKVAGNKDEIVYHPPIITNITGEAVDLGIMFPAQYGSPNFSTEGWYWCATVNTAHEGQFSYTVHVSLFDLIEETKNTPAYWKPVNMSFDASILISRDPMKNGFTGAGDSYLPI